mmetsp:Transcript_6268/g.13671  ORF Transcript_6268/g.13671 Transcript_6268/m.13671 type:complete len:306 (-) Transcript_6268:208-1125(-)
MRVSATIDVDPQRRGERRLSLESEGVEEERVLVGSGVGRGEQLVAREDRVGARHEHHGLFDGGEGEAAGREADHRARHDDARRGDRPRHLEDVWRLVDVERSPVDRHERVDRNRLGVGLHRGELGEQPHAVGFALTDAEDAAAADGDAGLAHVGDGLEAVVVGARGDHAGVVLARGVEVVVVGGEASRLELVRLVFGDHAERAADLEPHAVDLLHHLEDPTEGALLVAKLAPRSSHAEARGSRRLCARRRLDHGVDAHHRLGLDERLVPRRLRAVLAVLVASSSLNREKCTPLYLERVEVHPVHD